MRIRPPRFDPTLEQEYLESRASDHWALLRWAVIVVAPLYVVVGVWDEMLDPGSLRSTWPIRVGLTAFFLIFAAVPLAVVGVVLALLLTGGSINLFSGMGAVVLVGIVVNDSILKVDLLRRLHERGIPVREAIHIASRQRYRPILMTTATTALALTPLFFGRGAELRAPMAATLIGGLLSSTALTLLVIPVLFDRMMSRGTAGHLRAGAAGPTAAPLRAGAADSTPDASGSLS